MDLIAVNGYYVLVSMVLNVDRTPLPGGSQAAVAATQIGAALKGDSRSFPHGGSRTCRLTTASRATPRAPEAEG